MLLITNYDKLAGYAAVGDKRMTNSTYPSETACMGAARGIRGAESLSKPLNTSSPVSAPRVTCPNRPTCGADFCMHAIAGFSQVTRVLLDVVIDEGYSKTVWYGMV
jgi:hypothetical protein